jgi:hypothetical protein
MMQEGNLLKIIELQKAQIANLHEQRKTLLQMIGTFDPALQKELEEISR